MENQVNTFVKGMNRDTGLSMFPENSYYEARNMRITSPDNNTNTFELQNVRGNLNCFSFSTPNMIVGTCENRDELVVFTHNSIGPDGYKDSIFILKNLDETEALYECDQAGVGQNPDTYVWHGNLGFSPSTRLQTVSMYENQYARKVFFCDGLNTLKFINTYSITDVDGINPNDPTLNRTNEGEMEMVRQLVFRPKENLSIVEGGNLFAGKYQYAVRFFNINGPASNWVVFPNMIHVVDTNDRQSDTWKYFGSEVGDQCGKSIKIGLSWGNPLRGFVQVVAIKYTAVNQTPTINIVGYGQPDASGQTMSITDTGVYEGVLAVDEVTSIMNVFSAATIESKDNILFAGNIKKESFDIDYDARAFRFDQSVGRSQIYHGNGDYIRVYPNGDWMRYDSGGTLLTSGTGWSIPEDFDCIESYNNYDNDTNFPQQWSGFHNVYGGTGKNIQYSFGVRSFKSSERNNEYRNSNRTDSTWKMPLIGTESQMNTSYADYSSPEMEYYVGYQRNETYRFGIVFINQFGQDSFVKWIGDIRFPAPDLYDLRPSFIDANNDLWMNVLYIKFAVVAPTDEGVTGYRIVRCKRTEPDMRVKANGLLGVCDVDYPDYYYGNFEPINALVPARTPLVFISPETNINNLNLDDEIVMRKYFGYAQSSIVSMSGTFFIVNNNVFTPDFHHGDDTIVENVTKVSWGDESQYSLGNTKPFINKFNLNGDITDYVTKYVMVSNSDVDSGPVYNYFYTQAISKGVSYGGNTYVDRTKSVYFQCSENVGINNTDDIHVFCGDTYVSTFEFLERARVDNSFSVSIRFPVESRINLNLRHDDYVSRHWGDPNVKYIKETGNDMEGDIRLGWSDLYQYNSVYSQEPNLQSYFPKPYIYQELEEFDARVIKSQKKISGERICN